MGERYKVVTVIGGTAVWDDARDERFCIVPSEDAWGSDGARARCQDIAKIFNCAEVRASKEHGG